MVSHANEPYANVTLMHALGHMYENTGQWVHLETGQFKTDVEAIRKA